MAATHKSKPTAASLESPFVSDRGLFKELLRESLREVLDAEMTELIGAAPGERSVERTGYRAGHYGRAAHGAKRQVRDPEALHERGIAGDNGKRTGNPSCLPR